MKSSLLVIGLAVFSLTVSIDRTLAQVTPFDATHLGDRLSRFTAGPGTETGLPNRFVDRPQRQRGQVYIIDTRRSGRQMRRHGTSPTHPDSRRFVMSRGNRRACLFWEDTDRRRFLGLVSELPERFHLEVHGFVLMDNHDHLLVRTPQANLSHAIRWLHVSCSGRFN